MNHGTEAKYAVPSRQAMPEETSECRTKSTSTPSSAIVIDRACFNQGRNAKYPLLIYQDGVVPTLIAKGPCAVLDCREEKRFTFYALENHPSDSRVRIIDSGIFQTITRRVGDGGGNGLMVLAIEENSMEGKVRRLTPIECERLQGLEDNYTATGIDEKGRAVNMSDAARYTMIGNGMAQPCADYVIKRIVNRGL